MPSPYESLSLVTLESMACGVPVSRKWKLYCVKGSLYTEQCRALGIPIMPNLKNACIFFCQTQQFLRDWDKMESGISNNGINGIQ